MSPWRKIYHQLHHLIKHKLPLAVRICLFYFPGKPLNLWSQLPLLQRLFKMGYYQRISNLVKFDIKNQSVLDIGCGTGFYGPIYLLLGAAQYTGCDYKLSLSSSMARNFHTWSMEDMGVTIGMLANRLDKKLLVYEGGWEQLPSNAKYDLVTMYLVTEHLMDIRSAFEQVYQFVSPGGRFVFLHHNFYCWNGHHQKPQSIDQIDLEQEEQRKYIDWNHIRYQPQPDEYVARSLNRIRLDELKTLTENFFHIERWDEHKSNAKHGINRLTPEILASFPEFSERELTNQSVYCVAIKK